MEARINRWFGKQSPVVKLCICVMLIVTFFLTAANTGCGDEAGSAAGGAMNYSTTVENTGTCGQAGVVCNGSGSTVLINAAP